MILDRIKEYIDKKGITIAAFERSIGMSNASFGKSLKGGKAIGTDKLENILSIYSDINPSWLLTGEGNMLRAESEKENIPVAHPSDSPMEGIPLIPISAMLGHSPVSKACWNTNANDLLSPHSREPSS